MKKHLQISAKKQLCWHYIWVKERLQIEISNFGTSCPQNLLFNALVKNGNVWLVFICAIYISTYSIWFFSCFFVLFYCHVWLHHFVKGFINKYYCYNCDVHVSYMDITVFHYRWFSSGKYEEMNTPVTRLNESPDMTLLSPCSVDVMDLDVKAHRTWDKLLCCIINQRKLAALQHAIIVHHCPWRMPHHNVKSSVIYVSKNPCCIKCG